LKVVPVIMSGGAGSRLWPLSRETFPKPFITLPDGETLIRKTCARAAGLPGVERIVTVTNRELMFLTADEYEFVAAPDLKHSLILEPIGRDTAPAVALACLHIAEIAGEDAIALVMPADHLIPDDGAFGDAVAEAVELAKEGRIATFGIKPDRPETGYGYIEAEGTRLVRFVEKPELATAKQFVDSGGFFWNAGIFCFPVAIMLDLMSALCPEVLEQTRAAYEAAKVFSVGDRLSIEVDKTAFAKVPAISIDYAVMERVENAACVPCTFNWSDIGSWNAFSELVEADERGNRVSGDVMLKDTSGTFVRGSDRMVSAVGVNDLLIVDTADALLVCARDAVQDIKQVYNELKARGSETAILHRTAHRPWGSYTVLEEGERFKIKRIEVKPGGRLSLQAHKHRSEHWVVVSGTARVTNGDSEILLATDHSTYIPCGNRHRLENAGDAMLVMIEVQSGSYLGEDDIVRFDDEYGRVP
jgi:mannose-1-phosphate guanylyltransferase / mannose-6-phosphate isomerase